ncbi:uncharacterized protein [Misgurnus anguillicaudatus]|uniref:uncharacterized protein n=1 Tax=Misgurnus anguillicaudatus TaxID=75329 RepID=UPI003CCF0792
MAEGTKGKTKRKAACLDHCYAEAGDVKCDVCTERKHKAVKSCLVCLNSYCQTHLERHEEHDTIPAQEERTEKQKEVQETQRKYHQRIQESQKKLQELRDVVETHKRSAQTAVDDTERIFTQLITSIERRRSEVTQLIRDQEKTAVSETEGLLKRLEQEIDDLRRRDAELEQLSHTDDHIHFLQSFQSLSVPPGSTDSLSITVSSLISFDDVGKSVSHLREKLEDFCREEIEKIFDQSKAPEPETREQFLKYYHHFTADPNTANLSLHLSEGNRVINYTNTEQQYPDHPDRFNVLCSESLCGRCYWEIEWSGYGVFISVSYKSISRKGGDECPWSLCCSVSSSSFFHNKIETKLPVVSRSSRIGVYVDHSSGSLSFYNVSDTMTLIHRVNTTFTKPLYPGFWVYSGSVKLCDITI